MRLRVGSSREEALHRSAPVATTVLRGASPSTGARRYLPPHSQSAAAFWLAGARRLKERSSFCSGPDKERSAPCSPRSALSKTAMHSSPARWGEWLGKDLKVSSWWPRCAPAVFWRALCTAVQKSSKVKFALGPSLFDRRWVCGFGRSGYRNAPSLRD